MNCIVTHFSSSQSFILSCFPSKIRNTHRNECHRIVCYVCYVFTTQNQRTTEWVSLGGTTAGHLVWPPCSNRVIPEHTAQGGSQHLLNIPSERDSTASLGDLFQCVVTHIVKQFSLRFSWKFLCIGICMFFLILLLGTIKSVWCTKSSLYVHLKCFSLLKEGAVLLLIEILVRKFRIRNFYARFEPQLLICIIHMQA